MKFAIIEKSTGNILHKYKREDYLKHQAWGGDYGNKNFCDHMEIPEEMDENFLIEPVPTDGEGDWALAEDTTAKDIKISGDLKEAGIAQKMKRMDFGKRVIAIFSLGNDAKELNAGQKKQLLSDLAVIKGLLETGNIEAAKADVAALAPDALITAEDIAEITAEMDTFLVAEVA